MAKAREAESVVVMELSRNDIREIHRAIRDRSATLKKEADRLRTLQRHREADSLEKTVSDMNERLSTQFAAELDISSISAIDRPKDEKKGSAEDDESEAE